MKINSELPICMLGTEYDINEYEFVLFHLFKSNKQYHDYFMNLRKTNPERLMILDNSAYEFFITGDVLDLKEYISAICELKPQIYILPDVLMDMNKTLTGVRVFLNEYSKYIPKECQPMAVIQGNDINEIIWCCEIYAREDITKYIAIPFHNTFFKMLGIYSAPLWLENEFTEAYNNDKITDDMRYAMGRVLFMERYTEYFKQFKYIHLLGSHCPFEKTFYKDWDSMDTGYPVKLGYNGQELFKEKEKPNCIIDDFLEKDLNSIEKQQIFTNVKLFKEL